jgi:hypothetical protein
MLPYAEEPDAEVWADGEVVYRTDENERMNFEAPQNYR